MPCGEGSAQRDYTRGAKAVRDEIDRVFAAWSSSHTRTSRRSLWLLQAPTTTPPLRDSVWAAVYKQAIAWPRWRRWSIAVGVPGAYTATPLPILQPGPRRTLPPSSNSGETSWTWPTPSALSHPPGRTSGTNLSLQLNKGAWLSSLAPTSVPAT